MIKLCQKAKMLVSKMKLIIYENAFDSMLKGNPKLGFGRTDVSESLDEKYDLYHKTFLVQCNMHMTMQKKKMGITVNFPKRLK